MKPIARKSGPKKPDKLTPGDNMDAMKAKMASKGGMVKGKMQAKMMKGKMAPPYGKMPPPPPAHK